VERKTNAEVINHNKAQDNHSTRTINKARQLAGTSFTHHPCREKKGVEIHRSINAEATIVDQDPGRLLRRGLMS
jgi:hypothetical protein